MMQKRTQFDSSEVIQRADELLNASSSRYRLTVQIANRAKHYQHDDFQYDSPMRKPVIRAIMEMSDELTQPEIISEFIEPSPVVKSAISKRKLVKTSPPPLPSPSAPPFTPPPTNTTPPPEPSEQILQINTEINANLSLSSPSESSKQALQINTEINANPQLQQLKQEANSNAWNSLIDWISESVCKINFSASEASVKRLQYSYRDKSPREMARVLIVQKSLQAAGVDFVKGIPVAKDVIRGLAKYDLPQLAKLSAEMVYQIADIYGFDLQAPERKVEALTTFGAVFLGEKAIESGIDWLKYGMIPSKIMSAAAKALMIYAVGNAACLFYEAKLKLHVNPLTSVTVLNEVREESQLYLDNATSEEGIVEIISIEIDVLIIDYTKLSNLLKTRDWKKADQETRDIVVKIANRDLEGNLKNLPSEDISIINKLWLENSNGHFGFSVQKQIYLNVSKQVGNFGEKIGWRGEAGLLGGTFAWKSDEGLTFNLYASPKGHLPAFPLYMPWWYHKGEETRDFAQAILERNDW